MIAIEPETGFIRALISSPSYDPNYLNNLYSYEIEKILQDKDSASVNLIYQGSAVLLLSLSVFFLTLRYSKKLGMDKKNPGEEA